MAAKRRMYLDGRVRLDVQNARIKRGRPLNPKIDRCVNCLHFLPKNERCGIGDRHHTTATGSCALHERAASDIDLQATD